MIRNEVFDTSGKCLEAETIDLAAGTVTFEVDGKVVRSRPLTDAEVAAYTPPEQAPDPLSTLLADLAKATTVAQIRAAAAKAAEA
jgi:hypothetical protein